LLQKKQEFAKKMKKDTQAFVKKMQDQTKKAQEAA